MSEPPLKGIVGLFRKLFGARTSAASVSSEAPLAPAVTAPLKPTTSTAGDEAMVPR